MSRKAAKDNVIRGYLYIPKFVRRYTDELFKVSREARQPYRDRVNDGRKKTMKTISSLRRRLGLFL